MVKKNHASKIVPILAIVAGLLVIINPDFIRWAIGLFLIVYGIVHLAK